MANFQSWVLTDVDAGVYVENLEVTNADLKISASTPWSVRKVRLRGGLCDGVDLIDVDNGALSFAIVPTRGMGIWKGSYHGWDLGWQSPVRGPVHPGFVDQLSLGGIGWLAGFDEWIVRCGLDSHGAPGVDRQRDNSGNVREMQVTLHGRIANLPAHYVEVRIDLDPPHEIQVIGAVDEAMLFFPQLRLSTTMSTTPGSSSFTIRDTVTNLRSQPAELELLYHCNFGPPLLEPGARLLAPARMIAPRGAADGAVIDHVSEYPAPTPGVVEQAYWFDLHADPVTGKTLAVLQNAAGDKACALRYAKAQLPWFTLWKNPGALSDGYVTGLEPGTDLPNLKTFERDNGRVMRLASGESHQIELTIEAADGAAELSRLTAEVARLQSIAAPIVHREPSAELSPGAGS